ncbi:membrane-associated progesterone-binding 4 [Olea europaea subsp. europaea]|uniref:Membrane-associated progesterone-binding 4 n=1 Tax=Olea europaea subsp. europaea TaxID=158383 RepID=A0A8S0UE94_OLEEU|nr:membrane-associated progesterone-binding 4 [Olea europaea subsp. europaea]
MRWSPFFWIPICLALLSFFLFRIFPFNSPHNQPQGKLFTAEELAPYNGTDPQLPILLGILGSVFDVTKGKSHYGAGGGYNHFAGRSVLLSLHVCLDILNTAC